MGSRSNQQSRFFGLAFRAGLISGVTSGATIGIGGWGLGWLSSLQAVGLGLMVAAVVTIAVYLVLTLLLKKRLAQIDRIVRNIAEKKFEKYEELTDTSQDEIDRLSASAAEASQTMEKEIDRLKKIENYRKEFIGDISHELKTPIFTIQGFIETLLDGAIDDPKVNRSFLEKAMRNVNRLIYLTRDLMEISRLETGELASRFVEIDIRSVILEVVESLQYKAQEEGVEIRTGRLERYYRVRADLNQVKQVLVNLIENGIKYNRKGGWVEIGMQPHDKDRSKIIVYVKDSGVGIEENEIGRVTERFYRVDKSRSREQGGTGLGLAIVKHIIESHGEELQIESRPGKGSTFSFTLSLVGKKLETGA